LGADGGMGAHACTRRGACRCGAHQMRTPGTAGAGRAIEHIWQTAHATRQMRTACAADSGVGLGLQDLAATVEAGRADVVTQVRSRRWSGSTAVPGAATALWARCMPRFGGRLLVLLNGHGILLELGRMQRGECDATACPDVHSVRLCATQMDRDNRKALNSSMKRAHPRCGRRGLIWRAATLERSQAANGFGRGLVQLLVAMRHRQRVGADIVTRNERELRAEAHLRRGPEGRAHASSRARTSSLSASSCAATSSHRPRKEAALGSSGVTTGPRQRWQTSERLACACRCSHILRRSPAHRSAFAPRSPARQIGVGRSSLGMRRVGQPVTDGKRPLPLEAGTLLGEGLDIEACRIDGRVFMRKCTFANATETAAPLAICRV
jgi:hypothetical protein